MSLVICALWAGQTVWMAVAAAAERGERMGDKIAAANLIVIGTGNNTKKTLTWNIEKKFFPIVSVFFWCSWRMISKKVAEISSQEELLQEIELGTVKKTQFFAER